MTQRFERLVYKAYLIESIPSMKDLLEGKTQGRRFRRVLVDPFYESVFIPTHGWTGQDWVEENYKLKILPEPVKRDDWWDGWWTSNWKEEPSWAWCYMLPQDEFVPTRKMLMSDGTEMFFAA